MIIPIGTDSPIDRSPVANYILIGLNVAAYLLFDLTGMTALRQAKSLLMLHADQPRVFEFITYQFLHADLLHLFFNMLFLWVFGNSVNARTGHATYIFLYLAGGVSAALGFAVFSMSALLGASGAVAAITTAYLVLFPRTRVSIIYWFFFIGRFELPSMIIIVLKIILWDNIIDPYVVSRGAAMGQQVAHSAHLAGYAFGFLTSLLLLWIRAVPRSHFDILSLWRRAYQRQSMAAVMRDPAARARARYGHMARPVKATEVPSQPLQEEQVSETDKLKIQIGKSLAMRDWTTAADLYGQLVESEPRQVLPRQQQLDVANQLMSLQRHVEATEAYEKFLRHYSAGPDVEQVHMLLGVIYGRYLKQYEPAEEHLAAALKRLRDPKQRQQCERWLSDFRAAQSN
jgi:membrane associated rhomboid family serine protease